MSTRACRFFLAGNCRNGASCRFYHEGFSSLPLETRAEAQEAQEAQEATSASSGSRSERRTSSSDRPAYAATRPCHWYMAGYCHRGDSCWFSHDRGVINTAYGGTEDTIELSDDEEEEGIPENAVEDEDEDDQKCAICFEVPQTFGLLVPSSFFPTCAEQKEIIIQNYKEATSRKPCKYFKESGERRWCRFGDDCHFAHLDENGEPCKVNPDSDPRRNRSRRHHGRRYDFTHRDVWDTWQAASDQLGGDFETLETLLLELSRLRLRYERSSDPDTWDGDVDGVIHSLHDLEDTYSSWRQQEWDIEDGDDDDDYEDYEDDEDDHAGWDIQDVDDEELYTRWGDI
ncbi:hypothetical protein BGZ54_010247 [Gamsiella multidivaricata]|nr:hypothetical protein BGZ54_010247 [Gamsiella multidivaricata]